jgi:prepilin-type N-terminal cleavage/methylation domain-containing protein
MSAEFPAYSLPGHTGLRQSPGFTIIEIMIVVAIIGTLAIIAIPSFINARQSSQNASFLNSLRLLSQEMELYTIQEGKGDYPPDAPAATLPPGFEGHPIRNFSWTDTTPIGGQWDWDRAADRGSKIYGCYAGISVISPGRTSKQMEDIDEKVDDGNLAQGKFRQHAAGYIYALED